MVFDTVPPDWVRVSELLKLPPEVVDSSKPVGAVTAMFAVSHVPEAVKFCSEDADPAQLEKADTEPEIIIVVFMLILI